MRSARLLLQTVWFVIICLWFIQGGCQYLSLVTVRRHDSQAITNLKRWRKKRSYTHLGYYPRICLKSPRKATKNLHHNIWALDRCLKPVRPQTEWVTQSKGCTVTQTDRDRQTDRQTDRELRFQKQRTLASKYKQIINVLRAKKHLYQKTIKTNQTLVPNKFRNVFIAHVYSFPCFDSPRRRNCHFSCKCLSFRTSEHITKIFNSLSLSDPLFYVLLCVCERERERQGDRERGREGDSSNWVS
jgi:hypothetical protein